MTPARRRWIYDVALAVGPLLTGYGAITTERWELWVAFAGAVLVPGLARRHVTEQERSPGPQTIADHYAAISALSGQWQEQGGGADFLPLDRVVVDGFVIPGNRVTQDVVHDVADASLTVTFTNVKDVQVDYVHNRPLERRPDLYERLSVPAAGITAQQIREKISKGQYAAYGTVLSEPTPTYDALTSEEFEISHEPDGSHGWVDAYGAMEGPRESGVEAPAEVGEGAFIEIQPEAEGVESLAPVAGGSESDQPLTGEPVVHPDSPGPAPGQ